MASKTYKFTGEIRWAKVFEHNRDMHGFQGAAEEYGGLYSVEMKLDEDQWKELKASGSQKQPKRNDPEWVKFTRKHEGPFEQASGAPRVVHKDNTKWDVDDDGTIGNGSQAEVTVVVYDTKAGVCGTRLEKVKILDHVEYIRPDEDEDEDETLPEKDKEDIPF